jgi:hypothetical protein
MPTLNKQEKIYIVNSALEGGIGYWSLCDKYDGEAGTATIRNMVCECEHYGEEYRITPATVAKGLRVLQKNQAHAPLGRLLTGDYDAWDADACIQSALFGEVLYG